MLITKHSLQLASCLINSSALPANP